MSETILDLSGNVVEVGDRIAYAATDGRSAGLRVGRVSEIVLAHEKFDSWDTHEEYPRKVPTKLRVLVEKSSGYWAPEKPVLIEARFQRFVKLG